MAAFYAGGSIAPPDCEPLPAPRDAAAGSRPGGCCLACAGVEEMDRALEVCLASGEALARSGLGGQELRA